MNTIAACGGDRQTPHTTHVVARADGARAVADDSRRHDRRKGREGKSDIKCVRIHVAWVYPRSVIHTQTSAWSFASLLNTEIGCAGSKR